MSEMAPEQYRALAYLSTGDYRFRMSEVRTALRTAADEVDRLRREAEVTVHGIEFMEGVHGSDLQRLRRLLLGAEASVVASSRDRSRLRSVIENAPHDSGCQFSFLPEDRPRRCTCWKADAL